MVTITKISKSLLLLCVLSIVFSTACQAFVMLAPSVQRLSSSSSRSGQSNLHAVMEVELKPEPDTGRELTAMTTMPGCRMKELEKKDGNAFKFWLTAQAEGELIKEIRNQILKDASKKANFPGFRKGQVPPYAQPQISQFAVQEAIIKTVQAAVDAFGLKSMPGSDGEVNVHEDVSELAKRYKTGDTIPFTATLNCEYDPEKQQPSADATVDAVVDAEVVSDET